MLNNVHKTLIISVLLFALGCQKGVDVGAVQDYVKTVNAAASTFSSVADDFGDSCRRIRELSLTKATDLRLVPTAAPPPAYGTTNQPLELSSEVSKCQDAVAVSDEWNKRNTILVGYVRALGAIAGVDTKPTGFDTLSTQLTNVGVIKDAQATPFSNLATTIASLFFQGEQEKLLRKYVHDANTPLTESVESLKQFVTNDYKDLLRNELTLVDTRYRDSLQNRLKKPYDLLQIYSVREEWSSKRSDVNDVPPIM